MMHEKLPPIFTEHLHAQLQNCDIFICISRNSENDLLSYCCNQFPDKKLNTRTIKLGADILSGPYVSSVWPLPDEDINYILCVGTIEPRKNHNLVLDAFDLLSKQYSDICLVIVGREGWNCAETISRIQKHELLGKRLFWLSGISDDVLADLYKNAFLTVVPSLYEGFGLPVTEALQRGCLILSSDRGALKEAGGDFVDYFNPEDLPSFTTLLKSHLSSKNEGILNLLKKYKVPSWSDTVTELNIILNENFSSDTSCK